MLHILDFKHSRRFFCVVLMKMLPHLTPMMLRGWYYLQINTSEWMKLADVDFVLLCLTLPSVSAAAITFSTIKSLLSSSTSFVFAFSPSLCLWSILDCLKAKKRQANSSNDSNFQSPFHNLQRQLPQRQNHTLCVSLCCRWWFFFMLFSSFTDDNIDDE